MAIKTTATKQGNMIYRYLGNSGLKVSVIGFGNWITSNKPEDFENTYQCMLKAFEGGVNFFDTAEIYGNGNAEIAMGKAIKKAGWRREDLVISTKFMKCGDKVNDGFLSRKHLIEGIHNSLERLQLSYVDVIFCHRPDPCTPLEETCRAMNWIIEQGKAFYWGTSEWSADQITEAYWICEKLGLIKPIVEQPQYHLFCRERFEKEHSNLFSKFKMGTTIWSPLAGGLLTGKYNDGNIPEGTRFSTDNPMMKSIWESYFSEKKKEKTVKALKGMEALAKELGCSQAQLALAWTLMNTDVSTAIIGATKINQVEDNLGALDVCKKWTKEIEEKMEKIFDNQPEPPMNFTIWKPHEPRRITALATPSDFN